MTELSALPRLWPTIAIPAIATGMATYWTVDLDSMPPIEAALDGSLAWLLETAPHRRSLVRGPDDAVERDADAAGLRAVAPGQAVPESFRRFIEDPDARRHIRSATACYLDLGQFSIATSEGGRLIHFLSDQQSVLHWLLYVRHDGSDAVLTTWQPLGFDDGEHEPIVELELTAWNRSLAVCADTFEQFIYRYWAMNELFFKLGVDKVGIGALPPVLRTYAQRYPRTASTVDLFAEDR